MTLHLPDANILIYCLRTEAPGHKACRRWLEALTKLGEPLALCELVEVALLRITTLPTLRIAPIDVVLEFWDDLKRYPETVRLSPGERHGDIFRQLIRARGKIGNDLNDAWLAALAIEHNATLVSADGGFARFPGLLWSNPFKPVR
jgi:toxin-antitoxin system PIN domain toxin